MRRTTRLKALIAAPEILVMPGVHDALGARLAEAAGFSAATAGGYGATATLLGRPDSSQLSLTELSEMYSRLCDATALPLLADADTGFGNVTNVARTVQLYEKAGVAGLFIEDQVFPKRCGHMAGKAVVPPAEWLAKIKAALDARVDPDFVIMARTDALAVNGLDDAIERAQLACEAGADLLFVEAPTDVAQMRRICAEVPGPCLANNIETGLSPLLPAEELRSDRLRGRRVPGRRDLCRRARAARSVRDDPAHRQHGRFPAAAARPSTNSTSWSDCRRSGGAKRNGNAMPTRSSSATAQP